MIFTYRLTSGNMEKASEDSGIKDSEVNKTLGTSDKA